MPPLKKLIHPVYKITSSGRLRRIFSCPVLTGPYASLSAQAGSVVADETEKGWYIQWIDRDPRLLAMQEAAARRQKEELDDEEKQVS